MTAITGGELFARALAAEGIEYLFGLPSPEIDPLMEALERNGIRLVPIRHEAAGAHLAMGLHKTTGKVSAVLGNPGPGAANLIPGAVTALHEGVPMLAISSQHRLGLVYPSTPATFQGQDQLDLYRPAVKWGAPILQWTRIPEVLRMAFREMWNGRPGPVHIDLPSQFLYEVGDEADAPIWAQTPTSARSTGPRASTEQLDQAADLLAAARHPLIVAGTGVDRAGAHTQLVELVDLLGCPVIPTMAGRSVIDGNHPAVLMGYGEPADQARREADVMLVLGSRMGNLDLPYDKYWGDPATTTVVQIDIDPRNMGVTRPLTLGIVGEVGNAMDGLLLRLRDRDLAADRAAREVYRKADEEATMTRAMDVMNWAGPGIHPAVAMLQVGMVFGTGAIYTVDGGNTTLWAQAVLPQTGPRSYHTILELGMLGTGIPSAVGAALGCPDRDVVCVTGDGAAGFHVMELQTAARERLPLTVVVMAEGRWTMEEPNELDLYGRTFGTDLGETRWDHVAVGLGCHAEYVDDLEQLYDALQRAKDHSGPSVVCVRTSHEANLAIPKDLWDRFFEVYSGPTTDTEAQPEA